uniref:U-scoloptoxin(01)-Cw1a n=1 Tax=Cormocephalus westwoodi TaxID=1096223 RepID=TX11A_CORWE|nr:RecName: Full=U-scoloptoxin(01)-Cw1a; Short=U-SLPTX(01)-Cw1a; Flags: Precursor [Cormocephalus westwoodi]
MSKATNFYLFVLLGVFVALVRTEDEKPPNLTRVPSGLSFSCDGKKPGYYADQQMECQVYHVCTPDNEHAVLLCGPGTIFNQKHLVCDFPSNYACADAAKDADDANAHAFEVKVSPTPVP